MSRHLATLALALFASSAHAQIDPITVANIVQDGHQVGLLYGGLPPGPCRSVEVFMLGEDYGYPGVESDGFSVEPGRAADESLESMLRAFWDRNPNGRVVTVEIEEFSASCP